MSSTEAQPNYTELNHDDNMERFFNSLVDCNDEPSMKNASSPGSDFEACYQPIALSSMCSMEPNYKQLNYHNNIERFFSSLQIDSNEPSMKYTSSPGSNLIGTSDAMDNFISSCSSSSSSSAAININSSNNVEGKRGLVLTKAMLDLHNEIIKMQLLQEYRRKQSDMYNRHLNQMTPLGQFKNTENKLKLSRHTALSSEPQLLLNQSINQSREMYTIRATKSRSTRRSSRLSRKNQPAGTRALPY